MDEARLWGALGVLLAVVGVAIIAPEALGAGGPMLYYGAGVLVAALVTVLVVVPNVLRRPA
jgi:hypothetical protein